MRKTVGTQGRQGSRPADSPYPNPGRSIQLYHGNAASPKPGAQTIRQIIKTKIHLAVCCMTHDPLDDDNQK